MTEKKNGLILLNDIQSLSEVIKNTSDKRKNDNKMNVVYTISEFNSAYYGNTVDGLIELLNTYKQNHPNEDLFHGITGELDEDGDVQCKHEIWSKRLETDEEYTNRIEKESTKLEKLYGFD